MIDDATWWDGNATTNEIRTRLTLAYGERSCPTQEQLQRKLSYLLADDLIMKDGARHDGGHYALTFKGKRKLRRCRQQQARAA